MKYLESLKLQYLTQLLILLVVDMLWSNFSAVFRKARQLCLFCVKLFNRKISQKLTWQKKRNYLVTKQNRLKMGLSRGELFKNLRIFLHSTGYVYLQATYGFENVKASKGKMAHSWGTKRLLPCESGMSSRGSGGILRILLLLLCL